MTSNAVKVAEAKRAEAAAALAKCEGELRGIVDQVAAEKREVARLDALESVTRDEMVALENARRRLRKLPEQRAAAQENVEDARRALEQADHVLASARRKDLHEQARADAGDVTVFVRGLLPAFLAKVSERLKKHQDLVAEAKAAGAVMESVWANVDVADPWEGIGRALRAIAKEEFDRSPVEVARRAKEEAAARLADAQRRVKEEEKRLERERAEREAQAQFEQYGWIAVGPQLTEMERLDLEQKRLREEEAANPNPHALRPAR